MPWTLYGGVPDGKSAAMRAVCMWGAGFKTCLLLAAQRSAVHLCPAAWLLACSGDQGGAGRVAELEAALQAAERDVGEAEAMAQEAMEMAEAAQVGGAAFTDPLPHLSAPRAGIRRIRSDRGLLLVPTEPLAQASAASSRTGACFPSSQSEYAGTASHAVLCRSAPPSSLPLQAELAALRSDKERLEAEAEELRAQVGLTRTAAASHADAVACLQAAGHGCCCWVPGLRGEPRARSKNACQPCPCLLHLGPL